MTTTQFQSSGPRFDTPESDVKPAESPVETSKSPRTPGEFASGASIYRRLDRGRRQPKLVTLAPAVALGILAIGGIAAYLILSHPAHHAAPAQLAQAAPPPAAAPMSEPAPAPTPAPAAAPKAAAPSGLRVTHAAPARYAAATPRHARSHARSRGAAASATESGVNASATVASPAPSPPAVTPSAPAAAPTPPPVIQAPTPTVTAPTPSSQA
ncbi:MAG TPA: hypothetical protein VGH15_08240 [Caulobacteraceae bacterium]|jgi:hypothetical protein